MLFKELFDAIFRGSILESAFEAVDRMHEQARAMYDLSLTCLIENKDEIAKEISSEDHVINVAVREVRREILNYLAINSAPDISSSLELTGIVIDYERIGDFCKNIAHKIAVHDIHSFLYKQICGNIISRLEGKFC